MVRVASKLIEDAGKEISQHLPVVDVDIPPDVSLTVVGVAGRVSSPAQIECYAVRRRHSWPVFRSCENIRDARESWT